MILRLSIVLLCTLALVGCSRDTDTGSAANAGETAQAISMTVYKTPQCGCCTDWVAHMEKHGFSARVIERDDLAELKDKLGVPDKLRSCHTAVIGDHVIEGHVPARVVQNFLGKENAPHGLAVPGMPLGSPGMEMGERFQPYAAVAFDAQGNTSVYRRIETPEEQYGTDQE